MAPGQERAKSSSRSLRVERAIVPPDCNEWPSPAGSLDRPNVGLRHGALARSRRATEPYRIVDLLIKYCRFVSSLKFSFSK